MPVYRAPDGDVKRSAFLKRAGATYRAAGLNYLGIVFMLCSLTQSVHAAPTASPGDVLIIEINADPASALGFTEPEDEYLELYNNSGAAINLEGWTLNDNGGTTITLPNLNLEAGKILVVAHSSISFSLYGCSGANMPLFYLPTGWFSTNLANTSDNVVLRDNLANIIDRVSYGTDTSAIDPPAPDVFNNTGRSLQRQTYNTGFVDTDTNADWAASTGAGTPCDVSPTAISLQSFTAKNSRTIVSAPVIGAGALFLSGIALWRKAAARVGSNPKKRGARVAKNRRELIRKNP